ncbi:tetratricopeptide repeat protein 19 homolog, mitochondrial [Anthonomus grandis grandis]|uniref:tetratricopeptide repeat protein 19 homolog, mitochondrial n=1 Tax=Anthonomus grandis grandis TaxID=2921223 RepID=UPI0021653374|nr:tetratricopeptide repeat protein 19 homolog, mitochondrial [Anthonomus grandis grandis]
MFKITQIACKFVRSPRVFYPLIAKSALKSYVTQRVRLYNDNKWHYWSPGPNQKLNVALALSILSWLGFEQEDEDKESELIMTLKRAVLCTQREEYDKAEQMLHLALRMAQQQQNQQGILYCYDLMANLAFDTYELDKAEKLFVNVLQLLLGNGLPQNDLKVIHISLKLARICQLKSNSERADIGYRWCLEQIESHKKHNQDAKVLYGVINDWYAQYLLDTGDMTKALVHLTEAYNVCTEIMGEQSEKVMLLLNDLGITSFRAEDYDTAEKFLKEAITLGRKLDDKSHLGVIHANLGLILLQKGVFREAEKFCVQGRKLGRKYDNPESIEQSNYCLDQLKLNKEEQAKKA